MIGWFSLVFAAEPVEMSAAQPLALRPIKPPVSIRTKSDPRPPLERYITDVHTRSSARESGPPTPGLAEGQQRYRRGPAVVIERSNAGASIDDLSLRRAGGQVEDPQIPDTPIPELPDEIRPREESEAPPILPTPAESSLPATDERGPGPADWGLPDAVMNTRIPVVDDGMAGNRQVALTPFPNLDIQSGPLEPHQMPWSHRIAEERPLRYSRTLEFQSMAGLLESNGADDIEYGWYNSVLWSAPFWKEKGVGIQLGVTGEPTTFPQVLTEVSFAAFHRSVWGDDPYRRLRLFDRLSWGSGFDGVYDSENRVFVGQHRTQLGYAMAPNREVGTWFAVPLGSEVSSVPNEPDLEIATSAHVSFYYRHVWTSELDATTFCGAVESPGGFMAGAYLSYRFAPQAAWVLQGVKVFGENGGHSLYTGIRFYVYPLSDYSQISGNPENRYRAFMAVPDHINLQFRKSTP